MEEVLCFNAAKAGEREKKVAIRRSESIQSDSGQPLARGFDPRRHPSPTFIKHLLFCNLNKYYESPHTGWQM
jgi:hypothetical protein